ncbi:ATP-binding domain-containing protein [Acinetobacter sp. NIPH 1869]|uniref:ATP-binding domain-containing protein n=1 Tax=Acinetobacter higginsii TaxID=70347 RepID=UPI001F4A6462|nr:ATP-binding domain-containing protein [Acinetobacter higginsii]MCH7306318.1 ATP-binding domain-containing protein [Acinetobacter higginsii]
MIDEAQDLPDPFFRICYKLVTGETGKDKNIVWAYDDLQTIFNIYTRTPLELFGSDHKGNPFVDLSNFSSNLTWGQSNDIVLHKCYRNPLDVLVTAHALGFGLYDEPVQILENMDHWKDVGYELIDGVYEEGKKVIIKRNPENSPLSISKYQQKNDIIKTFVATSMEQEVDHIVNEIKYFIDEGLKPSDIMIISLDDRHAKSYFRKISYKLSDLNILTNNILLSSSENPPFILDNMITLTTVHRAKGNEAACVFVLGIDSLYPLKRLRQTRNRIFTVFTRTKAWLRISGIGTEANHFKNEIDMSLEKSPNLEFIVLNKAALEHIQRDLSEKEQLKIKFRAELNKLQGNGLSFDEIEEEMQRLLGGGR